VRARVAFRLYQLEADRYSLLRQELDAIIEQRLLEAEARRRGVSVDALLAAEAESAPAPVTEAEPAPVTEAEIDAYLAEHPRDAARGPAIRPRIAAYLAERRKIERRLAFVQGLREAARVDVRLAAPARPRTDIDVAGAPARGPED